MNRFEWKQNVLEKNYKVIHMKRYPMFIEPTITCVPLGFSGYIWLNTKNCVKKFPSNNEM